MPPSAAGATSCECEPAGTAYFLDHRLGAGVSDRQPACHNRQPPSELAHAVYCRMLPTATIMVRMDLLMVAREAPDLAPTMREISDPADARQLLPKLPHGPQVAPLLTRLALGVLVLNKALDSKAARAAIGVAMQRSQPRAVVVLGHDLGRELLGEVPLAGGIRKLHSKYIANLGQAKAADSERILIELCQKAGIAWAPPSARAARRERSCGPRRSRRWLPD